MASFVVETYVSGGDAVRFADEVAGIGAAAKAQGSRGLIEYVRSYLVPSDEMGFHVIEAETAADVARVTRLAGIEVERIVRVIGVEPAEPATDGRPWSRFEASAQARPDRR